MKMKNCHLCSGKLNTLVDLGEQPISNRFVRQQGEGRKEKQREKEPLHTLTLSQCQQCGLIQLANPPSAELLKPIYDWITYVEPEDHLDELAGVIARLPGIDLKSRICAVSFKDDSLVERMRRKGFKDCFRLEPEKDLKLTGLKTSSVGIETVQEKLTPKLASSIARSHGKADLVIARHILEHAQDTRSFMKSLSQLLKPEGYLVVEVPDCESELRSKEYPAIWEEHVSYFTPSTLQRSLSFEGFTNIFYEKYPYPLENSLVIIARARAGSDAQFEPKTVLPGKAELKKELALGDEFAKGFEQKKKEISGYLLEFKEKKGNIALLGAGHLSCAFINFFGLKDKISLVIDDNPNKKGLLMPLSHIPIAGREALLDKEKNIRLCLLGVNPRQDDCVIEKNKAFLDRGGEFNSIFQESRYALRSQASLDASSAKREGGQPAASAALALQASKFGLAEKTQEVFNAKDEIIKFSKEETTFLNNQMKRSARARARICAHRNSDEKVQEMIISISKESYLRPHKHIEKSESFHIIEGFADVVIFDDDGSIREIVSMGPYDSGKKFYYRIDKPLFHTMLIKSESIMIHETTTGPFRKEETVFADWAPDENETAKAKRYMEKLARNLSDRMRKEIELKELSQKNGKKPLKFIIIGVSGFLTKQLYDLIKSEGYEVIGTQPGNKYPGLPKLDLFSDDIREVIPASFFEDETKVCGIVCDTALQIDKCFLEKEMSYKLNVEKTIDLLRFLQEKGAKAAFFSSSYVFSGEKGYYLEEDERGAVNEYGRQKVMVEEYLEKHMPGTLVFRIEKTVGDSPYDEHLFTEWLNTLKEKKPIICIKDQIFAPTYAKDIARAVLLSCEKGLIGKYNVANTEYFSREELARQFLNILGQKGEILIQPMEDFLFPDARPLKTYLDSSKFINETGFRFTTIREGLEEFKKKMPK